MRLDQAAPLGLRERKKQMTRQAILETAQAMFDERGYDHVTVAEIADAVNISANTVSATSPPRTTWSSTAPVTCSRPWWTTSAAPAGADSAADDAAAMREMISTTTSSVVTELERLHRTVNASRRCVPDDADVDQFEQALADALAEETGEAARAEAQRGGRPADPDLPDDRVRAVSALPASPFRAHRAGRPRGVAGGHRGADRRRYRRLRPRRA